MSVAFSFFVFKYEVCVCCAEEHTPSLIAQLFHRLLEG
jgi:hypothetical protein